MVMRGAPSATRSVREVNMQLRQYEALVRPRCHMRHRPHVAVSRADLRSARGPEGTPADHGDYFATEVLSDEQGSGHDLEDRRFAVVVHLDLWWAGLKGYPGADVSRLFAILRNGQYPGVVGEAIDLQLKRQISNQRALRPPEKQVVRKLVHEHPCKAVG